MKLSRKKLLDSDYDTLFTRNPGHFIEAIIINIMWAKGKETEAEVIERQRLVFEKWLGFYTNHISIEATSGAAMQQTIADAERRGKIEALTNLPIKKGRLSNYVDLLEVSNILRQLKALEPKGVEST